jgi:hypothetical protein
MAALLCSKRGNKMGQMSSNEGIEKGSLALYHRSIPGLGCTPSEMIGRHGWRAGVALCTECREQVGGVGG